MRIRTPSYYYNRYNVGASEYGRKDQVLRNVHFIAECISARLIIPDLFS